MNYNPTMAMNQRLEQTILTSLKAAFSQLNVSFDQAVEFDTQPQQGDLSTNVALKAAGKLQFDGGPRKLSQALVEALNKDATLSQVIDKVEPAGPGFINFYLSDRYVLEQLDDSLKNKPDTKASKQKVIVEFTDPNPFKEFHIGHLYSNTVGEAISRLYEATGSQVQRVCYQGDVGMHVAKSVWGMRKLLAEKKQTVADIEATSLNQRVKFLGKAYALGATAFEEDEAAKEQMKEINYLTFISAQENLEETIGWTPQVDYKQHLKEATLDYPEIKALYQKGRAWSLEYFSSIYAKLGMKFDDFYFESIVGEYGIKIVREFLAKGIFKESQGAVIFPGSEYGLHDRVFINSLGLPTYECKELGLAPEKYRRFPYDLSIIITGNEINEYFKVLLTALGQTNPELAKKTRHMSHGMVRLPEGKMSSRTGKILTGEWLLEEANQRVKKILKTTRTELSESETEEIAEKVGLAAIKYAFLKSSIGKDIAFSFDESLSFQGNSGPYLLYTYVRAHSIASKSDAATQTDTTSKKLSTKQPIDTLMYILSDSEKELLRRVVQFPTVMQTAAADAAPHVVCTYLYQLCQSFNGFYTQHSVLGDDVSPEARAFRLKLTKATENVLHQGLLLLGIQPINKM